MNLAFLNDLSVMPEQSEFSLGSSRLIRVVILENVKWLEGGKASLVHLRPI